MDVRQEGCYIRQGVTIVERGSPTLVKSFHHFILKYYENFPGNFETQGSEMKYYDRVAAICTYHWSEKRRGHN